LGFAIVIYIASLGIGPWPNFRNNSFGRTETELLTKMQCQNKSKACTTQQNKGHLRVERQSYHKWPSTECFGLEQNAQPTQPIAKKKQLNTTTKNNTIA